VDEERLGDDVFDAEAGIERGEGILKDDLHIAAQAAQVGVAGGEQIAVFEADAAGSGLDEAKNHASERALAGTGFTDQSESFAGMDVKRNLVDGTDLAMRILAGGSAAEDGHAVRINLGQIADFDKRHG
jgi:hypothetical protein